MRKLKKFVKKRDRSSIKRISELSRLVVSNKKKKMLAGKQNGMLGLQR
jgi:hypothetical protein